MHSEAAPTRAFSHEHVALPFQVLCCMPLHLCATKQSIYPCLQGAALKDKTLVSELQLRSGEFLVRPQSPLLLFAAMPSVLVYDADYIQLQVALETKKPRQMRQPSKDESAELPLATAAGVAEPAAAAFLQQPMQQPQAQGLAMEPYQRSSPAVSPWSSPYRTPQGVSPADTPLIASAGHTPLVSSPVSSENTFTLLPGYVSRPGPSPLKPPRRSSPSREPGAILKSWVP